MKLFYKTLLAFDALALGFIVYPHTITLRPLGRGVGVCVSAKEPERPEAVRRQTQSSSAVAQLRRTKAVICTESYEHASPAPKVIRMKVTAYCPCNKCCGSWSSYRKTATGDDATICDGVAADFGLLPKRTLLDIPGIGVREVDDTGGAMRQDARKGICHIDVRMATHKQALEWGVRWQDVTVLKEQ